MKLALLLSLALLLPAASASANDEFPPRKPGLWSWTIEGRNLTGLVWMCIDAESEKRGRAFGKAVRAARCSQYETRLSGNTYTEDSVCVFAGVKQTSHDVATILDDETIVVVGTTLFEPPNPEPRRRVVTNSMKWLGSCGDVLKPGQKMIGGRISPEPQLTTPEAPAHQP